jgi:hypothetical protein
MLTGAAVVAVGCTVATGVAVAHADRIIAVAIRTVSKLQYFLDIFLSSLRMVFIYI